MSIQPSGQLLYTLNLQADPIPTLTFEGNFSSFEKIERMTATGEWDELPVKLSSSPHSTLLLPVSLNYLENCILRLT